MHQYTSDDQDHGSYRGREEQCKYQSLFFPLSIRIWLTFHHKFLNSFLSFLGDQKRLPVGDKLVACTSQLESIVLEGLTNPWRRIKGRRVVMVDTPGFDDTYAGDFEILQRIARWLEES